MQTTRSEFIRATALGVAAAAGLPGLLRAQPTGADKKESYGDAASEPAQARDRTIIDFHNHWTSPGEIELLSRRSTAPRIYTDPSGQKIQVSKSAGTYPGGSHPLSVAQIDVEARVRHLDEAGVRLQVVSTVGSSYDGLLSPEEARPLWRAHNDDLAELVRKHPGRFVGLASIPTANPQWGAEELERAHKDLGLFGATLPVDAFISLAGARALAPIFEVAQRHGSHIYLHRGSAGANIPGQHPELGDTNHYFGLPEGIDPSSLAAASLPGDNASARNALATTTHLAIATVTLTLTNFLDPYPDVTVQVLMLGGSISFVAEQIGLAARRAGGPDPVERLRRVYLDTGPYSQSPRGVALAAKVFGADRVLFGSDFGPSPSISPLIAAVNQAELTPEEKSLIFVENARRLLRARGVAV
jgi:predicted TIM-barrel fold metal-dependent hydrolase